MQVLRALFMRRVQGECRHAERPPKLSSEWGLGEPNGVAQRRERPQRYPVTLVLPYDSGSCRRGPIAVRAHLLPKPKRAAR